MPVELEQSLKRTYADLPEKERDRAVYGTLNKLGYMHGSKKTAKGRKAERNEDQRKALK